MVMGDGRWKCCEWVRGMQWGVMIYHDGFGTHSVACRHELGVKFVDVAIFL